MLIVLIYQKYPNDLFTIYKDMKLLLAFQHINNKVRTIRMFACLRVCVYSLCCQVVLAGESGKVETVNGTGKGLHLSHEPGTRGLRHSFACSHAHWTIITEKTTAYITCTYIWEGNLHHGIRFSAAFYVLENSNATPTVKTNLPTVEFTCLIHLMIAIQNTLTTPFQI